MTLAHQKIIGQLTLEEKVSLLSGANFWNTVSIDRVGIPSIMLTDGPHGLRKQAGEADHLGLNKSVPATCFPTAAALASSWDESLITSVGEALGREAAANNVNVVLGPGLNVVRDPLAGRAFEYFSEDPYITGKLAAAMIRGIQQNGVAATPKHFAVNSQEHLRMSIDEVVDERSLREIYLEGFHRAIVEGQPQMLMTAYNKVNGTYANEHKELLETILHEEWQYKGALVTDWGGENDPVAGVRIGGALEMPSSHGLSSEKIIAAVRAGTLSEEIIDVRVDTLLNVVINTSNALKEASAADYDTHHQIALKAAIRSMVLLKNDASLLPLAEGTRVALVGDFAKYPRYQGAGSSLVSPTQLISALDALEHDDRVTLVGYEPGYKRTGDRGRSLQKRAVHLAKTADVVIVYLGLDESKEAEGIDRKDMTLPANQLELLHAIQAVQQNIIVVLAAGGAVEVPFADDVTAIIHSSLTGQATGQALADIVTGRANPSGKLALSWPYVYSDAPTAQYFPGRELTAEHREGIYVGYRYYETTNVPVRYEFGYGLSYASFVYSDISVTETSVTFTLTNTSQVAGEEVAQVYICPPKSEVFRPIRELKGFAKVSLASGEARRVTINFDEHSFSHYDVAARRWATVKGDYIIEVGASVRDIRLQATVSVVGDEVIGTYDKEKYASYFSGDIKNVPDEAFRALLGRELPPKLWNRKVRLGYDDTIAQLRYRKSPGYLLYGVLALTRKFLFAIRKPYLANNVVFLINLPFSKIPGFSGGKISEKTIKWLLRIK